MFQKQELLLIQEHTTQEELEITKLWETQFIWEITNRAEEHSGKTTHLNYGSIV